MPPSLPHWTVGTCFSFQDRNLKSYMVRAHTVKLIYFPPAYNSRISAQTASKKHLLLKSTVNHRPRSDDSMQRTVQSVPVDVHGIPALAVIRLSASQKPPTPIASGNPEKPPDLCIELKHRLSLKSRPCICSLEKYA